MYCIQCGVKLADSEKTCPLCGTRVYHPDISRPTVPAPYPVYMIEKNRVNPKGILFLVTAFCLLAIGLVLLCDLKINRRLTWSGYAMCGTALAYIVAILPGWFPHPNPVIFVPIDFGAAIAYLLYVDLATSGQWFLSFAFPVVGGLALITTTVITLCRYVKKGYLFIFGGALIALGCFMLLVEFFVHITFGGSGFVWSLYPLTGCCAMGVILLIIGICPGLKESLQKKFFI